MIIKNDFSPCIIRNVSNMYSIVYSYHTGYYYLTERKNVPYEYSLDGKYITSSDFIDKISSMALSPKQIDVSEIQSPIVISIMLSNDCNLNCKYCISRNARSYSNTNSIIENLLRIHSVLNQSACVGVIISGGEPTLVSNLDDFINGICYDKCLIELDSNGTTFTSNLISTIKKCGVVPRISLDSIDSTIHNSVRGKFEETIKTLQSLSDLEVEYRINTVLHKFNKDGMIPLAEWLCLHNVKKWHIYKLRKQFAPNELWLTDEESFEVLNHLKALFEDKIQILFKFAKGNDYFSSFMVDSEGHCFSTTNKKIIFGSLLQTNISSIWKDTPIDFKMNHLHKFLYYPEKKM